MLRGSGSQPDILPGERNRRRAGYPPDRLPDRLALPLTPLRARFPVRFRLPVRLPAVARDRETVGDDGLATGDAASIPRAGTAHCGVTSRARPAVKRGRVAPPDLSANRTSHPNAPAMAAGVSNQPPAFSATGRHPNIPMPNIAAPLAIATIPVTSAICSIEYPLSLRL